MDSELIAWRQQAGRLVDVRLMAELQQLVQVDRSCEAHPLVLLAELDERQLYLAQGYSSLFRYAVSVLRMSEAQAYLRIRAARVARAYPVALEMFVEGALNLSTLKLLAPTLYRWRGQGVGYRLLRGLQIRGLGRSPSEERSSVALRIRACR